MAYCRKSPCSDVYVLRTLDGGVECCGCELTETGYDSVYFTTEEEMLRHLEEHTSAGHKVPKKARWRLKMEAEGKDWVSVLNEKDKRKKLKPKIFWL